MKSDRNTKNIIRLYYLYEFLSSAMLFGAIFIPFYKEWGGINQTQIQILQSFFWIFVMIFELPTGVISDRFGRKTSMILGSIFWLVGSIVYASTPNFYIFILGEFIFAIGKTLISGSKQALIYDNLVSSGAEEKAKAVISRGSSFELVGIAAGNLTGALLAEFIAVNHVFMLTAIVQLLTIIIILYLKEPQIEASERETKKWTKIFSSGIGNVLSSRTLRILSIDFMFSAMVMYFVIWFYQVELYNLGIEKVFFGVFSVILVLSEAFVLSFQARIEKLFGGERSFLIWTSVIGCLDFFAVAIFDHWIAVLVLLLTSGAFGLSRYLIYPAILNKFIDSRNRATSLSTLSLLRGAAVAAANPIMGYLADWNFENTLFILGILGVFGIAVSFYTTKELTEPGN